MFAIIGRNITISVDFKYWLNEKLEQIFDIQNGTMGEYTSMVSGKRYQARKPPINERPVPTVE